MEGSGSRALQLCGGGNSVAQLRRRPPALTQHRTSSPTRLLGAPPDVAAAGRVLAAQHAVLNRRGSGGRHALQRRRRDRGVGDDSCRPRIVHLGGLDQCRFRRLRLQQGIVVGERVSWEAAAVTSRRRPRAARRAGPHASDSSAAYAGNQSVRAPQAPQGRGGDLACEPGAPAANSRSTSISGRAAIAQARRRRRIWGRLRPR